MYLRNDEGKSISGKQGQNGCFGYKCEKCVVVAVHGESGQPGAVNAAIGKTVDYLRNAGF